MQYSNEELTPAPKQKERKIARFLFDFILVFISQSWTENKTNG